MKFMFLLLSFIILSKVHSLKEVPKTADNKTNISITKKQYNSQTTKKQKRTFYTEDNNSNQSITTESNYTLYDYPKPKDFQVSNSRIADYSFIRFLQNTNNNNNNNNNKNTTSNNNSSSSNQNQKIFYEEMNFTLCGSSICNDAGGLCLGTDNCKCFSGYLDPKDNSIFKCTYLQYDAKIAFFLEFFVGFGCGHLYLKRYFNGMLKLCVYLFLYLFAVVIYIYYLHYKKTENDQEDEVMIASENPYFRFARIMFMCSCFFTCIIWQITDSILFYSKFYNDGNDFPLYLYE
jgi:hypothetical protein